MSALMKTKVAGKTFEYYWKAARMPVFAAIVLSVIQFLFMFAGFSMPSVILPANINELVLVWLVYRLVEVIGLVIPLYLGWNAVKALKYSIKGSTIAGAIGGLVVGLIGGIAAAIFMFIKGTTITGSVMGSVLLVSALFGIVTSPLFGAIMWAIIALIGAIIAENV